MFITFQYLYEAYVAVICIKFTLNFFVSLVFSNNDVFTNIKVNATYVCILSCMFGVVQHSLLVCVWKL